MMPFDGRRRRRRILTVFVVALLVVFGFLFYLLVDSYIPRPPEIPPPASRQP
jgi:hypothetical protein